MLHQWQCEKCGIRSPTLSSNNQNPNQPAENSLSICKESSSGKHIWKKIK